MSEERKFRPEVVYESFEKCAEDKDALNLEYYLVAYKELYRFFFALGSVFSFVASDIINKINVLEDFKKSDSNSNYLTIQSMVKYEKEEKLLNRPDIISGSRTVLRLHRALEFIALLIKRLSTAEPDDKTSSIAQECYKETLGNFHPWIIRKTVLLAMYTLPNLQTFVEIASGKSTSDVSEEMAKLADSAELVYNITQDFYKEHDLLNLP